MSSTAKYTAAVVPLAKLNEEMIDAAFVNAAAGGLDYPGGLKALMRDHRFSDSIPLGRHWSYTMATTVEKGLRVLRVGMIC